MFISISIKWLGCIQYHLCSDVDLYVASFTKLQFVTNCGNDIVLNTGMLIGDCLLYWWIKHKHNLVALLKYITETTVKWLIFTWLLTVCSLESEQSSWRSSFIDRHREDGRYINCFLKIRNAWQQIETYCEKFCPGIYRSLQGK